VSTNIAEPLSDAPQEREDGPQSATAPSEYAATPDGGTRPLDGRTVAAWAAMGFAVIALVVALVAVFVDAGSSSGGGAPGAALDAASAGVPEIAVSLSEFAITPSVINVPAGRSKLVVTNNGSMDHNLSIPALGVATTMLRAGQTGTIVLQGSQEGTFEVICTVVGHAEGGMRGTINVGGEPGAAATGDAAMGHGTTGEHRTMTAAEMDAMMDEVALRFPQETKGRGGAVLAPTVLADGTKSYDLTASIVDWEVVPGKVVKAWTYNGAVPGPTIQVDVGDKVQIVLHNELPESTVIHFHGVRVPNAMDGVPPYTQQPIKPGETFTYEFTAQEPAVGMYHSHHNAQVQVPNGLAGAFLIGDMPIPEVLKAQGLTKVDQQVNMVLNDAGTIGLTLNGKSFPATEPYKMKVGETMLVHYFNEGLTAHPMHLHQPKGWVIAKDGEPLLVPIPSDTINVAPGERYTVLYQALDPGVWAWHCHILTHAEGTEGMFGMVTAVIVE
jgi:manganese oxidase